MYAWRTARKCSSESHAWRMFIALPTEYRSLQSSSSGSTIFCLAVSTCAAWAAIFGCNLFRCMIKSSTWASGGP